MVFLVFWHPIEALLCCPRTVNTLQKLLRASERLLTAFTDIDQGCVPSICEKQINLGEIIVPSGASNILHGSVLMLTEPLLIMVRIYGVPCPIRSY